MRESWWERPTCFLCDWWWTLLIGVLLVLTAYFTRQFWMSAPPVPTATFTAVPPTYTLVSTSTPLPPTSTPTRVADLQTGDVQVTLIWASTNDLDLWVTDPMGETIYYQHDTSASGGVLDVDANAGCHSVTTQPVENIFWPSGSAPHGKYVVEVQYYMQCESPAPIDYQVSLLVDGVQSEFSGRVASKGEKKEVATFNR